MLIDNTPNWLIAVFAGKLVETGASERAQGRLEKK